MADPWKKASGSVGNEFIEFIRHLRFGHRVENVWTFRNELYDTEFAVKSKELSTRQIMPSHVRIRCQIHQEDSVIEMFLTHDGKNCTII